MKDKFSAIDAGYYDKQLDFDGNIHAIPHDGSDDFERQHTGEHCWCRPEMVSDVDGVKSFIHKAIQ